MNSENEQPDSGADLTTRSGFRFHVRKVRDSDEPALADFFHQVTPDDLRFRFLTSIDEMSHARLLEMIRVDQEQTESFLVTANGEHGTVVAVAMLAADSRNETAEVAISIRADHKGRGIGWTLLNHLASHAQSKGIKVLEAIESRDNRAAISLEREMGFVAEPIEGDPAIVALRRRLD